MEKTPLGVLNKLTQIIEAADFRLIVVVIDKRELHLTDAFTANPYLL
jgi:hypothetical protein